MPTFLRAEARSQSRAVQWTAVFPALASLDRRSEDGGAPKKPVPRGLAPVMSNQFDPSITPSIIPNGLRSPILSPLLSPIRSGSITPSISLLPSPLIPLGQIEGRQE